MSWDCPTIALPAGAVGFCSPEQAIDKKDNKNATHDDPPRFSVKQELKRPLSVSGASAIPCSVSTARPEPYTCVLVPKAETLQIIRNSLGLSIYRRLHRRNHQRKTLQIIFNPRRRRLAPSSQSTNSLNK